MVEQIAGEEGLTVLGWRIVPTEADGPRQDGARCHAADRAALRGPGGGGRRHHGARAARLRAAQAGRARGRRPLLPVALGTHDRLQGHAHLRATAPVLPRPARSRRSSRAWRWCTRAFRPTHSRAGRWRTRTATSATTARSTRWPATATGCAPARRCSRHRSSRATCRASTRSARPEASDSASFDEVLELLASRRALAAARRADDDPRGVGEPHHHGSRAARLLPLPRVAHGALGRPGRGVLHRRHGGRRGARPQRTAPGALLGHRRRARRARQRGRGARHRARAQSCARAGCSPAACSWSTRPRAGWSRTRRSRPSWRREHPYDEWLAEDQVRLEELPARTMLTPQHGRVVTQQRLFGYTNEELRVIVAPMARTRRRADRLHGLGHLHRRAVGPAAAAVRLLHPAVRPGDQPAARRHPRGAGDLAVGHHRPRGQPARGPAAARAVRSCCRCR